MDFAAGTECSGEGFEKGLAAAAASSDSSVDNSHYETFGDKEG